MKLIPVGDVSAMVDVADFESLSRRKWRKQTNDHLVYATTVIDGKPVKMERVIMQDFESYCIDHIDGNPLNNQRTNLRPATRAENACNRKDRRKPKTELGFGVHKFGPSFFAQIGVQGKRLQFGPFSDSDSAQRAYDAMRFLTTGEFAPLNQPERVEESIQDLRSYIQGKRAEYIANVVRVLGSKRAAAKALGISEASIYRE